MGGFSSDKSPVELPQTHSLFNIIVSLTAGIGGLLFGYEIGIVEYVCLWG